MNGQIRDGLFDPLPGSLHEPIKGREASPAEIFRRVALRRNFFQSKGMAQGDRVFIGYGNCTEFFVDLLSVWSLGATVVPLDTALTAFEIENEIRAVRPRFFLHMEPTPSTVTTSLEGTDITAIEARECEDARSQSDMPTDFLPQTGEALILFTSGSTSQPKGVVHTHQSLRAKWSALKATLGVEIFRRSLCMLPNSFWSWIDLQLPLSMAGWTRSLSLAVLFASGVFDVGPSTGRATNYLHVFGSSNVAIDA